MNCLRSVCRSSYVAWHVLYYLLYIAWQPGRRLCMAGACHMSWPALCCRHLRTGKMSTIAVRPLSWYMVITRLSARRKSRHVLRYINVFCCTSAFFLSSGHRSFLVLSAPGHARRPPEHHGASGGPGRGPWHVLWGFNVASIRGETFRARRAMQTHANPHTG